MEYKYLQFSLVPPLFPPSLCQLLSLSQGHPINTKSTATMSKTLFTVEEHVLDGQHIREYPRATITPDAPIKLAVKKYIPLDNHNPQPGDVTIIGTHGAGFPKVR